MTLKSGILNVLMPASKISDDQGWEEIFKLDLKYGYLWNKL